MTQNSIRLSLRELYEIPYRALRVAGASHGEAQEAAEAVQVAEINDGTGLSTLLTSCRTPWAEASCTFVRTEEPHSLNFTVDSRTPLDLLRYGSALVDLATCSVYPSTVRSDTTTLNGTIDQALLLAAARTGYTVYAAQASNTITAMRFASSEGDLGRARFDTSCTARFLPIDIGDGGTVFATGLTMPTGVVWPHDIRDASTLDRRRFEAGLHGAMVDSDLWAEVMSLASDYKQPDKEVN